MSSDEADMLDYTPLRRSQIVSKQNLKPSKLSLSQTRRQNAHKITEINKKSAKSDSSKVDKRKTKKNTPTKSRADKPEKNCSPSELAKWRFLYQSEVDEANPVPEPLGRRSNMAGSQREIHASFPQQKRKSTSEEIVSQEANKKQDGGICSSCKFPWSTLQQRTRHSLRCKDKDLSDLPRCSVGGKCRETEEEHFWKFDHGDQHIKISKDSPWFSTSTKTLKNMMKTNTNSSTNYSGCKGGLSGSKKTFATLEANESSDVILLSDAEDVHNDDDHNSIKLFKLESQNHQTHTDTNSIYARSTHNDDCRSTPLPVSLENDDQTYKESADSRSSESSNLLDSVLIPDLELHEDDLSTLYFGENATSAEVLCKAEQRKGNQKLPVTCSQRDGSSGSETDLKENEAEAADVLEDSEGDILVASVVEEAIDQFAMPALEKVMRWRRNNMAAFARTSTPESQNPSSKKTCKRASQPPCIHIHFHEASPAQLPTKESGQTTILAYFKPKPREETCDCGESTASSKKETVAALQGLMGRMQNKEVIPTPSISHSSSKGSDSIKMRWRRKAATQTCPFYKYIPETGIVVDAFNYGHLDGVTAYFLSHFHYDHYIGLQKNFNHPIYCSEITARLVNKKLGVPLKYLNPLPMWKPQQVCGVEVTLLDANHCPGAVMFLFKVKAGVTHLHVGDFRAHPFMESYSALQCRINTLFLDTTYCSPEHVFPTQERMIEKCVSLALDHHRKNDKTLFAVGSYTIGKERVFGAIAKSLDCSIWARDSKKQVLNCIDDEEIQARLTNNKAEAKVHVLNMLEIEHEKLRNYLNQLRPSFNEIVGLCPTGWKFTSGGGPDCITSENPSPGVYLYGIPYSEHSSFSELKRFVQFIKPRKIVPTVNNGNQRSRKKMENHFREWLAGRQLFT